MKTYIITLILLIVLFQNRSSGQCNFNDINSSTYAYYTILARSVVHIRMFNGTKHLVSGTGVLLNTTDNNGSSPYILTAGHMVDIDPADGIISQHEKDILVNSKIYFNYLSVNDSRLIVTGTTFIASSYSMTSDKATRCDDWVLLKLNTIPSEHLGEVFYAGWNFSSSISRNNTLTLIHHPGMLPKKISFVGNSEYRTDVCTTPITKYEFFPSSGAGTGSSGAPFFESQTLLLYSILSMGNITSTNSCQFSYTDEQNIKHTETASSSVFATNITDEKTIY